MPPSALPGRMYLLPKVHKPGAPGRPVISCSGALTENASEIVDYLIKPLLPHVTSYLRDTKDFVAKLRNIGTFPEDALIASLDVVSLYPSIPTDDGIRALCQFLLRHGFSQTKAKDICDLVEFVLTRNVFEFNSDIYLQTSGTAMGTRMAPTYAIIYMHMQETQLLRSVPLQPFSWLRFIDDVFCIWTHGEDSFKEFVHLLNNGHPTIKFTEEHSQTAVPFLDVLVQKTPENLVELDLYSKPTDTHLYLHPTSCHPGHVQRSIPYSQALRILNICSLRETALIRLQQLHSHLVNRGHSEHRVRKEINRAIQKFDHPSPPNENPETPVDRVNFALTYHPGLPDINKILREDHHLLHLNENLKKAIPLPPRLAFRRPPNLRNKLSRARLPSDSLPFSGPCAPSKEGLNRKGPPCQMCVFFPKADKITSAANGKTFKLKLSAPADCDTNMVVYCLTCTKCNVQYVGKAENLRKRVNNHKSSIRNSSRKAADDRGCRALYTHFADPYHSLDDCRFTILETCKNKYALREAETQWIKDMGTLAPRGLNLDDGTSSYLHDQQ